MRDSLQKYGGEQTVYVICLDAPTLRILEDLHLPQVRLVPLRLLEHSCPALQTAKGNRGPVEYYWTLTPVILEYLLQAVPAGEALVYLDADLYFYSDVAPVFAEMDGASVFIHAHNFPEALRHLTIHGEYNVGMMGFRHDAEGRAVLHWWKERCLEYTGREIIQTPDGLSRFGDQKYLDYFQKISQSVRVSRNMGIGVAPWNVSGLSLARAADGTPMVDGVPVVFYHYHSFAVMAEGCVSPALPSYPLPLEALRLFVPPYLAALEASLARIRSVEPQFAAGFLPETAQRGGQIIVRKERLPLLADLAGTPVPLSGDARSDFYILSLNDTENAARSAQPTDERLAQVLHTYTRFPRRPRLLNCGCGAHWHAAWLNVDIAPAHSAVLRMDLRVDWPLPNDFFDMAYHSHMLEHMSPAEGERLMRRCWRTLKPGGLMRVAVPDLEGIARNYLEQLDAARQGKAGAAQRRRWMVLELVDQLARHQSGGDMINYLRQQPVPEEDFVLQRIGAEGRGLITALRGSPQAPRAEETDPVRVGRFRLGGEIHRWMYDAFSLEELLRACGFTDVHLVRADESRWPDFDNFHLDTEPDGSVRKPDSLFMEARKPEMQPGETYDAFTSPAYPDWASAVQAAHTAGYAESNILEKCRTAALAVRDGKALWERDSVTFTQEQANQPLLTGLLAAAAESGKLHVLDFGGSLGSTCVQHRRWLEALPAWTWNVVEQAHFVDCGRQELQTDHLRFFHTVEEAMSAAPINVILLSSVLQYLEDSYALLRRLSALPVPWLILDRTPLLDGEERITVQHVPPHIYKAAYPCRLLRWQRVTGILSHTRELSSWFASAVDPTGYYGVIARRRG